MEEVADHELVDPFLVRFVKILELMVYFEALDVEAVRQDCFSISFQKMFTLAGCDVAHGSKRIARMSTCILNRLFCLYSESFRFFVVFEKWKVSVEQR